MIPLDCQSESIPAELKSRAQWVVWRLKTRPGQPKPTKVPYNPRTGKPAKTTDPADWSSFDAAWNAYESGGWAGVGFVFSPDDPYTGIDLDACVSDGRVDPWAQKIIDRFGTYCEVSPSGTGVKMICRATLPAGGRRKGTIEVYDRARYFTITGRILSRGEL